MAAARLALEAQVGDAVAEELAHVVLGPPEHRRCEARRRWHVLGDDAEELADRAVGDPVGHADAATRLADPQQLVRCLLLVGGEHRAEDGGDHVELAVAEGKLGGVALDELDRRAARRRRARGPARAGRGRSRRRPRCPRCAAPPRSRRCRCRRRRRAPARRGRRRALRPVPRRPSSRSRRPPRSRPPTRSSAPPRAAPACQPSRSSSFLSPASSKPHQLFHLPDREVDAVGLG